MEPIQHATGILTYMTILMAITGLIMLASEWLSGFRWPPIIVLSVVAAGAIIGVVFIFPINEQLTAGLTDNAEFATLFGQWANYHRTLAALWLLQWLAMMYYFSALARQAREDR